MTTYKEYLFVPKHRLGSLIGPRGAFRRKIEKESGAKLEIFKDGRVNVVRTSETDPVLAMKAEDTVRAIAIGFKPKQAILAMKPGYELKVIELKDEVRGVKGLLRQRARVIGKMGKAKKRVADLTGTHIAVDGNNVGLLGPSLGVEEAAEAVLGLVHGSPHGHVYKRIKERD